MICHSARELIQPLVDDELDAAPRAEVEDHLRNCVECAELYHGLTELRTTVRQGAPYYSAPEHLAERIRVALRAVDHQSKRRFLPWAWISGAAAAGLAAGLLLTLPFAGSKTHEPLLEKEVVSNHVRSLMASHMVDVPSSDQHTVKPWFTGKLDFSPRVVDLKQDGFELKGGRLDYLDGRTVAAIVFERRKHVINLFVWPHGGASDSAPAASSLNGFNLIAWTTGGMTYHAVSDLNARELGDFVRLYRQDH